MPYYTPDTGTSGLATTGGRGYRAQQSPLGEALTVDGQTFYSNDGRFAENVNAAILRSQYANWASTYKPIEDELLAAYKNPAVKAQATQESMDLFRRGYAATQGATDRRLASYGLTLTPEQQEARTRSSNLQQGLGTVSAFNGTARRIEDRDKQLLTGFSGISRTGGE
ncbi:MAG: hypothetical protein EPN60_05305 [Nevskiaceae bacterium]|nr:MAG: hypothetical protein EPN60_05305 [Nevskiaceae bacterium]